jgi:hypothetical protein
MPLYQLNKLCQREDPKALKEWKRRWEDDYPKIKKCLALERPAKTDN